MISRIPIRCLACGHLISARVQVGHERIQRLAAVCPECFTPFRFQLLLDNPPNVGADFLENCEEGVHLDGSIINMGAGFVMSRARLSDPLYFPVHDLPQPDEAALRELLQQHREAGGQGPLMLDLTVMLGGMPNATDRWRWMRNAYRFFRNGQDELVREQLRNVFGDEITDDPDIFQRALINFFLNLLDPKGVPNLERSLRELKRIHEFNPAAFGGLCDHFAPLLWSRMDEYVDVLDHFFRAYDEFNQTFLYVRRELNLPEDPYAASTDFDNTKLYYGEAFEVLGNSIDLLAAANNVSAGREFSKFRNITLANYRNSDKGRRADCLVNSPELKWLVSEYDNGLRNASHHRWLRLSQDRSQLSYRNGGDGELRTLSYAEYLYRCCAITSQIVLLASIELVLFEH